MGESRCQVNCLKELYRNSVRSRLRPMPWPARLLHLFKVQLCHPSRKLPRIGGCKTNNKSEWSPFKKNQVYLDTFSCVSVNFKLLIFGVYRFGSDASQGNWGGWRPSVAPGYARIVMPRMFEVMMERVGLWQRKWEYSRGTKDFLTYCLRGLSSRNWVSCIGSMKLMKIEWLRNASWFENCRIKLKTAGGGSGTWVVMRESSCTCDLNK